MKGWFRTPSQESGKCLRQVTRNEGRRRHGNRLVFKKLLKLVTVLTLLLGCYLGYVRAFTVVVKQLTAARKIDDFVFTAHDSKNKKEAIRFARESFGPDHWTAADDLQLRYYNPDRGFWMYAKDYKRPLEEDGVKYDGKRLRLSPAAIIWRARDGSSIKTVTAEEAIIDFNQALGFQNKPDAEPMVVKFARLERNVVIRDDRGTPGDPKDDMIIDRITWVAFDDSKLQIYSDSDVRIVDRDTTVTGQGMLIQLRPKSQPGPAVPKANGFEGAQSARLLKNVDVLFVDVGKTGILPGSVNTRKVAPGKVEAQAQVDTRSTVKGATSGGQQGEPQPLHVHCDGAMQVDLPKPPTPVKEGPPAPPRPTFVHFTRNVVVRRGKLNEIPDQLDCDNLDLTLLPAEGQAKKPVPDRSSSDVKLSGELAAVATAAGAAPAADGTGEEEKGLFGDLTLRRVKATGHAVWLQQPAEGSKIFCNEMIHEVAPPGGQGRTYFRGDSTRKHWMLEKFDFAQGPPEGAAGRTVESVTHVWTTDATVFDNDGDMGQATLVARGPGLLETRPGPTKVAPPDREVPADRTATWQDQLFVQNEIGPDKKLAKRILTLKGSPRVIDRLQASSLDSVDKLVVWLKPKPPEEGKASTPEKRDATAARPQGGSFQIERLLAIRDAHLVAPSKDLRARDRLDVDFEQNPSPVVSTRDTAAAPSQAAASSTSPADATAAQEKETPAEKTPEPNMVVVANRVKARVLVDPAAKPDDKSASGKTRAATSTIASNPADPNSSYQVREVRLFGAVTMHQDPAPGKTKGQDASGEALILLNEGPGKAIFNLYHRDPTVAKASDPPAKRWPHAKVKTEDMDIEGEVVGVNQKTDQAWAYGPGKLVQLTDRGMLTDRAEGAEAQEPEAKDKNAAAGGAEPGAAATTKPKPKTRAGKVQATKVPLTITWEEKMIFNGRSTDPQGRPAARAEFTKNVLAQMEDALLHCTKVMTTYTDQPIPLAELGKMSQSGSSPAKANGGQDLPDVEEADLAKPKPDLTLIDCVGDALAISRKVDPDRPVLLSLQRVTGDRLIYDRRTGNFLVPGPGMVYLYDRDKKDGTAQEVAPANPVANRRTIRPTSGPSSDRRSGKKPGNGATRNTTRPTSARDDSKKASDVAGKTNDIPPLVLTQIRFGKEMKGRFGTGKETDKTETRWAEFFTNVEAARGPVKNESTVFSFDRLPQDCYFLTSQTLRVVTEPRLPGTSEATPPRNFLKAWDDAYATTKNTTVQADVITYDSLNDLIYARSLEGRPVQIVQQSAAGQQSSPTRADAVRVNPKTGAADVIGPQVVQWLDARTGTRPSPVAPPDPNAKAPKTPKNPYRTPLNSYERKGFTGR
jgi:hypothetical protein